MTPEYQASYYQRNKERLKLKYKAHYEANKERINAAQSARYYSSEHKRKAVSDGAKRRRKVITDWITEYKLAHPCIDCGEADPIVLEFDHVDYSQKLFTIGSSTGKRQLKYVQEEAAKCVIRCANCHRRKTYNDRLDKKFNTIPKGKRSNIPGDTQPSY